VELGTEVADIRSLVGEVVGEEVEGEGEGREREGLLKFRSSSNLMSDRSRLDTVENVERIVSDSEGLYPGTLSFHSCAGRGEERSDEWKGC
jgi:hypothetical protein